MNINDILKKECNGCKVCKNICLQKAISFYIDITGFSYPKIDEEKCIHCNACVKKCPQINVPTFKTYSPIVYAAWSKKDNVRLESTSGGMFYELAYYILKNDGYVCGCVYIDGFKGAKHIIIDNIKDLPLLMVSKYLESDLEDIYIEVKKKILTKKLVLFVGSPCQTAGLISYLGLDYDNLLICDFVCRGTSSPKLQSVYVEYLENKYNSRMINHRAKDKRNGWNNFGTSIKFANGKEYFGNRKTDLRILAYHNNLSMRKSCEKCKFKSKKRLSSDITLGDYWKIDEKAVKDCEKGVSLVILNTPKGKKYFSLISDKIDYIKRDFEDAKRGNIALYKNATVNINATKFLKEINSNNFSKMVKKYILKHNLLNRIANKLKNGVKIKCLI